MLYHTILSNNMYTILYTTLQHNTIPHYTILFYTILQYYTIILIACALMWERVCFQVC